MRFDGTLKKWNADRCLGFVVADQGGEELFVHIYAFPRDGRVPAVGEVLSFEVETGREGKNAPCAFCAFGPRRQRRYVQAGMSRAIRSDPTAGVIRMTPTNQVSAAA